MPAILSTLRRVHEPTPACFLRTTVPMAPRPAEDRHPKMVDEPSMLINFGIFGVGALLNEEGLPNGLEDKCFFQMLTGPQTNNLTMCLRKSIVNVGYHAVDWKLNRRECAHCGELQFKATHTYGGKPRFKRCPCYMVCYCSIRCQEKDWRVHRHVCNSRK